MTITADLTVTVRVPYRARLMFRVARLAFRFGGWCINRGCNAIDVGPYAKRGAKNTRGLS